MSTNNDNNKTQIRGTPVFDNEKFTLLVNVNRKDLLREITSLEKHAKDEGFEAKEDLHVTIIGFRSGQKIAQKLSTFKSVELNNVIEKIQELINSTDWAFNLQSNQYRISRMYMNDPTEEGTLEAASGREAYIQKISMPIIGEFYAKLNSLLGLALEAPFLHITLYARGDSADTSKTGIAIDSENDFLRLNPRPIGQGRGPSYKTIVLPTRPQPDTIVAIFLLRTFGKIKYPGIESATIDILSDLPKGETLESLEEKGVLLLDVGGSRLDHHNRNTTASQLVAEDLGISANPALAKILQYAERDDKHGTGTISEDPLDRALGLSGIIAALNKSLPKDPARVVEYIIPLIRAHYLEERKRTEDLPNEFNEKISEQKAEVLQVRHKGKKTTVVFVESGNPSLSGWLRSSRGQKADVVVQVNESGFLNITTRQVKRIDLRWTAALLRQAEIEARKTCSPHLSEAYMMRPGRIDEAPQWYYDRATNSILNGSIIQRGVEATAISFTLIKEIVKAGLEVPIERRRNASVPLPEINAYFLEIRVPVDAAREIRNMVTKIPSGVRAYLPETYRVFFTRLGKHHNNDVPALIENIQKSLSGNGQFPILIDSKNFKFGLIPEGSKKSFYFEITRNGGGKDLETVLAKVKAAFVSLPQQDFLPVLSVASIMPNADERFVEAGSAEVLKDTKVEFPVTKIRLTEIIETQYKTNYTKRYDFSLE